MKFEIIKNQIILKSINVEEFKKNYMKLNYSKLRKKYNLTQFDLRKIANELNLPLKSNKEHMNYLKENPDIFSKKGNTSNDPKYYHFDSRKERWIVQKRDVYFGTYQTEKEAKKVVDYLKEINWDKNLFLKSEYAPQKKISKNYYFNKERSMWQIHKGNEYFGSFKTEEEAKRAVEFLKKIEWNKTLFLENKNNNNGGNMMKKENMKNINYAEVFLNHCDELNSKLIKNMIKAWKLKNLKDILQLTEDHLLLVDGFGLKTAKKISKWINGVFKHEIAVKEFKKDYLNTFMNYSEMSEKYGMSISGVKKLGEVYNIPPKEPIYYYFNKSNGLWKVKKDNIQFGSFKNEEAAKKAVEILKKNNWNKKSLFENFDKIIEA